VSVASKLGLSSSTTSVPDLRSLQNLSANRSQRGEAPGTADLARSSAGQKTLQALAAAADTQAQILAQQQAEAAAKAAAEAAAKAAADAAAKAAADAAAAASATPSSFQDYALQKLGGDQSQFSCLQSLWGKESGWNPNAQNPSSTAYGIAQLLDSTWAGTGIAKTSNGFRQIDAGLVYIDGRYGSPCGAWSHSRAYNWY
jgi:Transglycosylase SLT domain